MVAEVTTSWKGALGLVVAAKGEASGTGPACGKAIVSALGDADKTDNKAAHKATPTTFLFMISIFHFFKRGKQVIFECFIIKRFFWLKKVFIIFHAAPFFNPLNQSIYETSLEMFFPRKVKMNVHWQVIIKKKTIKK